MGMMTATYYDYDFGNVVVGETVNASVFIQYFAGLANPPITVTDISFDDPQFVASGFPALPFVMNPEDIVEINVAYTPLGLGTTTSFLTITSDVTNNPVTVIYTGTGVNNTRILTALPSKLVFPNTKVTTPSVALDSSIQNTGTSLDISVTGFTLDAQIICTNSPAFPFVLHPGDTAGPFHFIFTPTTAGFTDLPAGVSWASDASGNPTLVDCQIIAFIITPAFVLSGGTVQPLLSFVTGSNPVTKFSSGEDLNCEEDGFFKRIHDFGLASIEKTLQRLFFRYENIGSANVTGTFRSTRTGAVATDTKAIGSAGADGLIYDDYLDCQLSHDLLQIIISRLADDGPISLTEFVAKVVIKGEYIEGSG